jgi:hypothetical protein
LAFSTIGKLATTVRTTIRARFWVGTWAGTWVWARVRARARIRALFEASGFLDTRTEFLKDKETKATAAAAREAALDALFVIATFQHANQRLTAGFVLLAIVPFVPARIIDTILNRSRELRNLTFLTIFRACCIGFRKLAFPITTSWWSESTETSLFRTALY